MGCAVFSRVAFAAAVCVASVVIGPGEAKAATVGVAVDAVGSSTAVPATLVDKPALGGLAIRYFIPLGSSGLCTFGVGGCGLTADSGSGGEQMDMILLFSPVSTTSPSELTIRFEDLDLDGANDPSGFVETLDLFKGDSATPFASFTNIADMFASGDSNLQTVVVPLGTLVSDPFWARLRVAADSSFYGKNTAEYLRATVASAPLPAALPLFATGLALIGLAGWRRRRAAAA